MTITTTKITPRDPRRPIPLAQQVWEALRPRQRKSLIEFAAELDRRPELSDAERDRQIRARVEAFAADNAESQQLKAASKPDTSTLESRAELARMHAGGWTAMCDECGQERAVASGRPVARFCDRCTTRRAAEQARRQRAREEAQVSGYA